MTLAPTPSHRSLRAGVWRLADPKISLASFASMLLGAAAAASAEPIHWGWLAVTVGGIFALEVAKNASGEVVDWDSGVDVAVAPEDRSPFSGGKRVMVDGLLTRHDTIVVAMAAYALGIGAGLLIAFAREPRVLVLGLAGVALAYGYHARPLRLAYRGFGELAVALAYGPLICSGMYLVQRASVPFPVLWASLPLALLIAAFLWINQFPDLRADRLAGKRNLVVRLGPRRAARGYLVLVIAALFLAAALPAVGAPRPTLAGLVAAVPALWAARRLMQSPESTARIIPAQKATLLGFVLYTLGAGAGWLAR